MTMAIVRPQRFFRPRYRYSHDCAVHWTGSLISATKPRLSIHLMDVQLLSIRTWTIKHSWRHLILDRSLMVQTLTLRVIHLVELPEHLDEVSLTLEQELARMHRDLA